MPTFKYKAIDATGRQASGSLSARTEGDLAAQLDDLGLYLLTATTAEGAARSKRVYGGGVSKRELIGFSHDLVLLFSSGVPLLEGLKELVVEIDNPNFARVLDDVRQRLEDGDSLSQAMSRYPRVFPDTYVSMVAAGEASGSMEKVLQNVVAHLEWHEENKGVIVQALIYPCILFTAVIGLILLLLTFLLPRIANVFEQARVELPKPTLILLAISHFLCADWPYLVGGIVACVVTFLLMRRTRKGRLAIDGALLRVPFFGELSRKVGAATFCHTLGVLTQAGVAVPQALEIVSKVLKNAVLSAAVARASKGIQDGGTLTDSIKETNVFQPLVIRMMGVGERTGNLEEALTKVNEYYDRIVPQAVKRFVALLEPAIIVFAGLVVGFIVLCTLLPIFRLMQAIKH
ncbi:MAG: type II secretion system F family protein [Planctomycetes bacterium]|nr:type II secretion system F family protein [Planctomycetota bacterium]MBI3847554.1 type II secretion system F family protein [Planctomycetota bacterium]